MAVCHGIELDSIKIHLVSVLYDSCSKTLETLIPHEKKPALLYNCLKVAFMGAENFDLYTFCGTYVNFGWWVLLVLIMLYRSVGRFH